MTSALTLRELTVAYGSEPVVRGVSLQVAPDEVVALLGPSGSGKSTLLAAVAGFIEPREGQVLLRGEVVSGPGHSVPPEDRDVAVVFQHYALWPHLTAAETVAYPLRRRGVGAGEARRAATALLVRVGLGELAGRRPAELSGGQQQRVGLARALAREPSLYLFDEPTAHLDTALRASLTEELSEQRRLRGAAALYATHDAAEALAVADQVVLLREGRIAQIGRPAEVYEEPSDLWSAALTGPASVLDIPAGEAVSGKVTLRVGEETVRVPGGSAAGLRPADGAVLVRPEWAGLGGRLSGVVRQVRYRGPYTDYRLRTPAGTVDVRGAGTPSVAVGDAVTWDLQRVWISARS